MRALDCPVCGEIVQAEDDPALVEGVRAHVREEHGGERESDIEGLVESDAYAPPVGDPPWAY